MKKIEKLIKKIRKNNISIKFGNRRVKHPDKLLKCNKEGHKIIHKYRITVRKELYASDLRKLTERLTDLTLKENDIHKISLTSQWICLTCDKPLNLKEELQSDKLKKRPLILEEELEHIEEM